MATFECTAAVAAPQGRVFELFTDLPRAAERIQAIKRLELLTPGPLRVGSRFRETRVVLGKEATEEFEVTEFEPSTRYAVSCVSCGVRFGMRFAFRSQTPGTHIAMSVSTEPVTWFAKLMSPMAGIMLKQCAKGFEADIADLRKYCEAG